MPKTKVEAEKNMTMTIESPETFDFLDYINISKEYQTKEKAWLGEDKKE